MVVVLYGLNRRVSLVEIVLVRSYFEGAVPVAAVGIVASTRVSVQLLLSKLLNLGCTRVEPALQVVEVVAVLEGEFATTLVIEVRALPWAMWLLGFQPA